MDSFSRRQEQGRNRKKLSKADIMRLYGESTHIENKQENKQERVKINFEDIFTKQTEIGEKDQAEIFGETDSGESAADRNQAEIFGEMVRFLKEQRGVEIFGFGSSKNSGPDLTAESKNPDTSETLEHVMMIQLQQAYDKGDITIEDLQTKIRSIKEGLNQDTGGTNKSETYEHSEIYKRGKELSDTWTTSPGWLIRDAKDFLTQAQTYAKTKCEAGGTHEEGNHSQLLLDRVTTTITQTKDHNVGYESAGKVAGLTSVIYEELKDVLPPWPNKKSPYSPLPLADRFLPAATEHLRQATQSIQET